MDKNSFFWGLKNDFSASLVVFLVAVPLCLGIAMASNAPLMSGLISGIVGGIIVGSFSRSPLGVSGPAAGLAVIVYGGIEQLDSFNLFLCSVVLCGVFQVVMGIFRAGFISYFFPSSVIKGMLAGIGMIIFLKQVPHAVGYDKVHEGSFSFFQFEDGTNTISEIFQLFNLFSPGPLIISSLGIALLVLWERKWPERIRGLQAIPAPLVVVLLGIGLNVLFSSYNLENYALQSDQVVSVPVISQFGDIQNFLQFPTMKGFFRSDVITLAAIMAAIASLESLLCAEASDKLDKYKRVTPVNRELMAQGVGNIVAGLIGGIPVTQVIVRSSSNAIAGAKTKKSAVFHGCWIMLSLLFVPQLLNLIPLASLAAILLMVGLKLARPQQFVEAYRQGAEHLIAFSATVLGLLFTDLLVGIMLGLAVSVVTILWTNYRHPFFSGPNLAHPKKGVSIELAEDMSFLNRAGLMKTLRILPDNIHIVIDASRTRRMHPDIQEVIDDFLVNAKMRNIEVEYIGMSNTVIDHREEVQRKVKEIKEQQVVEV